MATIGFIGSGEMGSALAGVFRRAGAEVRDWDKDANKCSLYEECSDVASVSDMDGDGIDDVIFGSPGGAARSGRGFVFFREFMP